MIDPELKEELGRRFDAAANLISRHMNHVDRRFDMVDNHLRRMDARLAGMELNFNAFHKALDGHDRVIMGMMGTQAAQQQAIDQIVERLRRLEHPPQPQ